MSAPPPVALPNEDGSEGDVAVCGVCFDVHALLGRARDVLASYEEEEEEGQVEDDDDVGGYDGMGVRVVDSDGGEGCDNQPEAGTMDAEEEAGTMDAEDLGIVDGAGDVPAPPRRGSSEGPNGPRWEMAKGKGERTHEIASAVSFHGPIPPHHGRNKRDDEGDDGEEDDGGGVDPRHSASKGRGSTTR